ncbi:hypothetical protein [Streptomyces sp. NPDC127072]|uniref:hypothetical protein n=1 Tax=Streptomyces sp. NPDC127072 TaxID=3347129 RepID=UPI00365BB7C4
MSTLEAAAIVGVVLIVSLPTAYLQIRRVMRAADPREWDLPAPSGPDPVAALDRLRRDVKGGGQ